MGRHYRYKPAMSVKRVLADEGAALLGEGYKLIDVRTVEEFRAGHPAGAYNVPMHVLVPGRGKLPNPEFQAAMEARFPREDRLLVACAAGVRSLRAAQALQQAGWTDVIDLRPGFEGEHDFTGRLVSPGWRDAGHPVETEAPGRTWEDLRPRR
jgi:rhodanese-related sulfurtransferase